MYLLLNLVEPCSHLAEEVILIAPVHAVVLMVAHPSRHDAALVVTLEPVRGLQTKPSLGGFSL